MTELNNVDLRNDIFTTEPDDFGRKNQTVSPDTGTTTYLYDEAGNLKQKDRREPTRCQVLKCEIRDSVSGPIEHAYQNTGCTVGCSGGPTDKVIRETTPLGVISYAYDTIGRRTSMTVAGQPTVHYQYDANSRLTEINSLINGVAANFSLRHDAFGRRTSLAYPNGVTTNYTYDNVSRVLSLEHLNPINQILESLNYTYDENGNRISMNRPNAPVKLPEPASNITYNEANQMLTFNDKSMTYDENGNLTSVTNACGTTSYTWDARNRLVAVNGFASALTSSSTCEVLSASFKYDALGRRIEKTINGRKIEYLYDSLDIAQEIENGIVSANYLRTLNIDEALARLTSNSSRFYQTDASGSVVALTDETGAIKTQYVYDPFGNVTISGETSDNPFQYTGRENDSTGLYYYRARYYSPELQRFISEDPIGFWGGDVNFYAYVGNNPVKFTDRYGLIDYPHEVFPPSPAFVECVKGIQEYAGSSLRKAIEDYHNCKKNCDEDIDNKAGCYVDDFLKSLLKATCKSGCLAVYLKESMMIHFEVWSWETGCFMLFQDPYGGGKEGGGKEKDYRHTHDRE